MYTDQKKMSVRKTGMTLSCDPDTDLCVDSPEEDKHKEDWYDPAQRLGFIHLLVEEASTVTDLGVIHEGFQNMHTAPPTVHSFHHHLKHTGQHTT